ncbi:MULTISPECIES: hypothetical protein [unclassified Streptomyces]|uniref:hypothetical protein n=1 Tax=unclassified Streptomyces TaxID=2593676 RepID=UPI002ED41787|nr:hypothetical protein OH827_00780 [Streptomyces sp. NBC_00891]WSY03641.1 hypothetical protein OG464_00780 [Streptomyces sp. NBC_00890]WSZ05267.1 hypothetical protein OG704_00780 [Streptomyces sp. NBC_00869]WSZ27237.1 hypothetical protein OG498_32785 [Streptomyces sp. NBC_00870]
MEALIALSAAFVVFVLPTSLVWRLGRRARIPGWMLAVFVLAGWLTLFSGLALSQRAQPFLFPDTSPCYGAEPVSQYFPPDSFCRHDDGELRTVNGPDAKFVFWAAAGVLAGMPAAATLARHRPRT